MQLELLREIHFIGEQKFNVIIVIRFKFGFRKYSFWGSQVKQIKFKGVRK